MNNRFVPSAVVVAFVFASSMASAGDSARGSSTVIQPEGVSTSEAPFPPRVVRDANDKLVGYLIDPNHVVAKLDDHWIAFWAGPAGLSITFHENFMYTTTDCSGQAYVWDHSGQGFGGFYGGGFVQGDTLYYGLREEALVVHVRSDRDTPDGVCSAVDLSSSSMPPLAPLRTYSLADHPMAAPFHVTDN